MSSCIVPLVNVSEVKAHPNAERLELAVVNGWQVAVPKDSHRAGQAVLYFEPGLVIPQEWSDVWGVTKYLDRGRVKAIKLRGEPSFGFTVIPGLTEYEALTRRGFVNIGYPMDEGTNVADAFGVTKYVPKVSGSGSRGLGLRGDMASEHPLFSRYTSIENLRHNPRVFVDGEPVVVTEKIHGTNSRVGKIDGRWVAGSHRVQRLHPSQIRVRTRGDDSPWARFKRYVRSFFTAEDVGIIAEERLSLTNLGSSTYWYPLSIPGVRDLVGYLSKNLGHKQVILYGEIYGPGIQKGFDYGVPDGSLGYAAFDILLDGKYADHWDVANWCRSFKVPMVPVLSVGYYTSDLPVMLSTGTSSIGGDHIREGVVVRSLEESHDPRVGRKILKLVSDEYLVRSDGVDDTAQDVVDELPEAA